MNITRFVVPAMAAVLMIMPAAQAQKGMGETTGVARQAVKPTTRHMSGTVTDAKVGACEQTTGRAVVGAHLIVRTDDADELVNLHMGPLRAVEPILAQVPAGTRVSFEAFRTEAMPPDAYVAKAISIDGKVIDLRDDNLRPTWAGMGMAQGRGQGPGSGQGRGQGMGQEPGGGRAPCWW